MTTEIPDPPLLAAPVTKHPWARWLSNAPQGPFWHFFAASIFFNFGFATFFFLFNLYLLDLGLNERTLGLIGGLMSLGALLGTLPAGMLAQRFGVVKMLLGGLPLVILLSLLRAFVPGQWSQFVLAPLAGAALCTWAVALPPSIAALTSEDERPFAFSLMFASGIVIAGLGGLVSGRLPGRLQALPFAISLDGLHAKRYTLFIACSIAALALIPLSRVRLKGVTPVRKRAGVFAVSTPFLRRFLLASAAWSVVTGSFPQFANVFFVHHLQVSLPKMGSVYSISQLVQFLAVLSAPILFRRVGLRNGILVTQVCTAVALVALGSVHTINAAAAVYWTYMAAQYMNEPCVYSLLMDRVAVENRSAASASNSFVSAAAGAVASTVVGSAIVRFGYPAVLFAIAAAAMLAAILFRRLPEPADSLSER